VASTVVKITLVILIVTIVVLVGVIVGFLGYLNVQNRFPNSPATTIFYTSTQTITSTSTSTLTSSITSTTFLPATTITTTMIPSIDENLEIINAITTRNTNNYTITIDYKNLGTTDIAIENIFVGPMPLTAFWYNALVNGNPMTNINIPQRTSGQLVITFPDEGGLTAFAPGVTVTLKIQTASGFYYFESYMPGAFTEFEKLMISAYANSTTQIILNALDTGSSDVTITDIFLNEKPLASASPLGTASPTLPILLKIGDSVQITLNFATPLSSGTTYNIKIHTASGNDYPTLVIP
jgi:hypothetical protein